MKIVGYVRVSAKDQNPARQCYIDGIWNKESVEDWLTEIQLPVK